MKILKFRLKKRNGSDYNVRTGGQLINKIKKFEYLKSIVQENGRIV